MLYNTAVYSVLPELQEKYVCLYVYMVFISMVVVGADSDVMGYDRRMSELSYAPLHTKQDTTSIE